jgi:CheY-like chemotaxis protein
MDKQTVNQIFEPFFTTKVPGEGTGLGLATVYGIVKQNLGLINVYSEQGRGTSFKIYFPCYKGTDITNQKVREKPVSMGNGESILLVEDEAAILDMTKTILQNLGYLIIASDSSSKALKLASKNKNKIDLLITDVVMPGMNGKELAVQLKNSFPGMKTLYMSGYTSDIITNHGVLDHELSFISKPFSRREIASKIKEVLK